MVVELTSKSKTCTLTFKTSINKIFVRDHQGSFECHWIDCNHRGAFSGESVLMRHIKTQHVNPRSIDCPSCGKSFNRKDNMMEHLGRAHREYI